MNTTTTAAPKRPLGFGIIGLFALVWNLIGVAMWYLQVNLSAEQLAAMTEAQRQVYEATPGWLNIAFGTVPLDAAQWLVCVAMGSLVLWFAEARKAVLRSAGRWSRRPVAAKL